MDGWMDGWMDRLIFFSLHFFFFLFYTNGIHNPMRKKTRYSACCCCYSIWFLLKVATNEKWIIFIQISIHSFIHSLCLCRFCFVNFFIIIIITLGMKFWIFSLLHTHTYHHHRIVWKRDQSKMGISFFRFFFIE